MNNKLIERFLPDIKNVFTIEKLKEYLKLPLYTYIICFFIGVLIPVISAISNPESSKSTITPELFGLSSSSTWSYIIQHNLLVLFTLFISGIIPYIGSLFGLGLNGLIHGLLLGASVMANGINGLVIYLLLMGPHGIFEIPAFLFGTGAGIVLSRIILNAIIFNSFNTSFIKGKLYEAFLLILISACLFFIASVIETQITFKLLDILNSRFSMNGG